MRSVVVLPHPEGPTKTMNSSSWILRLKSCTAVTLPNRLYTCSRVTSATHHPPGWSLFMNRNAHDGREHSMCVRCAHWHAPKLTRRSRETGDVADVPHVLRGDFFHGRRGHFACELSDGVEPAGRFPARIESALVGALQQLRRDGSLDHVARDDHHADSRFGQRRDPRAQRIFASALRSSHRFVLGKLLDPAVEV